MAAVVQPWQVFVVAVAGWINRQQDAVIEYLREENRVLKQQLDGKRLRLTDAQRRRLAAKGKVLGYRALSEVATLVTPDTIMAWHRRPIAKKWTHRRRSPGRARTIQEITDLVVRMAKENPRWGYTRIRGALWNLGHDVGRTTVANILKDHGIEPAPERGRRMTWRQFLKAHWSVLAAADFFTVEVWGIRGLVTFYVFFVMELATRRVEIAGITPSPNDKWMTQIGRNLTDPVDGFLLEKRVLLIDRDSKYSTAFRQLLDDAGVEVKRLPARSPNLNAHAERFVRSIMGECLSRVIFLGERSLRRAAREYTAHYHRERNHQGLDNRLIETGERLGLGAFGDVNCRERLGGLLRFYLRAAA